MVLDKQNLPVILLLVSTPTPLKEGMPQFTFYAHNHKLSGPKTDNDTDVTLKTDESQRINISPFALLPPNTPLTVTISYDQRTGE